MLTVAALQARLVKQEVGVKNLAPAFLHVSVFRLFFGKQPENAAST